MGNIERDWQDTEYVLSFFGKGRAARRNYLRFIEKGIAQGKRPELVGGGLIRSLGGWAEVLGARRRGEKQASDQRILGDGKFVEAVLSEMNKFEKENLRLTRKKKDLTTLAKRVCDIHDVSLFELRSGSRRHDIVEARGVLSWLAVKESGYSGAEVARYLGVTTSCVTRAVERKKGLNKKVYL
jgi:hypothetical protein